MQKSVLFLAIISCILLSACSSNTGEKIQKKIEKAGWEMNLKSSNDDHEIVYFVINANEKIIFLYSKMLDNMIRISYAEGSEQDYVSIPYDNEKATTQHVVKKDDSSIRTCSKYDLENNQESIHTGDEGKCTIDEVNRLKQASERAKVLLNHTGITFNDIITWSEWKYNIKYNGK